MSGNRGPEDHLARDSEVLKFWRQGSLPRCDVNGWKKFFFSPGGLCGNFLERTVSVSENVASGDGLIGGFLAVYGLSGEKEMLPGNIIGFRKFASLCW